MWVIHVSQPGLPLSEARGQPLYAVYRGRWLALAKVIYWFHKRYGKSSIMMLEHESTRRRR